MGFVSNTQLKSVVKKQVDSLKDGSLKPLLSNFASQIETDREIEDADEACPPIVFGTVGGEAEVQSGLMKFEELRGNTIKWNQYAKRSGITARTLTSKGLTCSISTDGLVTVTGTIANSDISDRPQFRVNDLIGGLTEFYANHTYYLKKIKVRDANVTEHNIATGGVVYNTWSLIFNDNSSKVYEQISTINVDINVTLDLTYIVGDSSAYFSNGDVIDEQFRIQIIDLTDIYGAGNEPSTVAEFVRDFPKPYYAYNAGTLLSSKSASLISVGRNQWDEEWEVGSISSADGSNISSTTAIRSKNYIRVIPGETYYIGSINFANNVDWVRQRFYDINKQYLGYDGQTITNGTFTVPQNAAYVRFNTYGSVYGNTYNHDICIYINWDTPGLPYVAYEKTTVTLPNLELRSAGSVYDVAYQQGGGKRRIGSIDMGDATNYTQFLDTEAKDAFYMTVPNFKTIYSNTQVPNVALIGFDAIDYHSTWYPWMVSVMSLDSGVSFTKLAIVVPHGQFTTETLKTYLTGKTLYYELETETDITTTENPGWDEHIPVDNFGTLQFTQNPAQDIPVPQAYFIRYTVNLVEFLDSAYVRADGDADNILTTNLSQTDFDAAMNAKGYYKQEDLSSGITDSAGLTYSVKTAYKSGKVVTLTIVAVNNTASSIASDTTLFSVASGLIPSLTIAGFAKIIGDTATFFVGDSGNCTLDKALAVNSIVRLSITYSVS